MYSCIYVLFMSEIKLKLSSTSITTDSLICFTFFILRLYPQVKTGESIAGQSKKTSEVL